MIDIEDILIGGIAKRHQLRVATTNIKHFSKITEPQLVGLIGLKDI